MELKCRVHIHIHRFQMLSPLLQTGLDDAKRLQLRRAIADENNISVRTLYRYEKAFAEKQFAGLKPADREKHRSQNLPENFEFLLEQAVQLRKEVPERSVAKIIYILEAEGLVAPGILKRSTLERHIYRAGYGQRQMQMYKEARNSSSKRFCKPHRMMLIQGDIKYGPKLPIGKHGAKVQTYLSSAIDDHSPVSNCPNKTLLSCFLLNLNVSQILCLICTSALPYTK